MVSMIRAFRCVLFPLVLAFPLAAATCDSLTSLKLANTTITSAQTVMAGAFTRPAPSGGPVPPPTDIFKLLPAFCRVQGVIEPTGDSHIEFEVWLPASGWNGKYLGVGNGGFAGAINYAPGRTSNAPALATAVLAGYATSSTDTGHRAGSTNAQWALGHPEKIVDYGYRAIHETAETSKAIIRAFYGDATRHSYFSGCSNGGRQALMEAQRYPSDYDGIIAGAPSNAPTHMFAAWVTNMQATEADPTSYVPAAKLPALDAAVLSACDKIDGLQDGLIDNPTQCRFNPAVLLCRGPESDSCLTQPQIAAVKKIYAGARTLKGEQIYPGFLPGGEAGPGGWTAWITGTAPGASTQHTSGVEGSAFLIFQNPNWDYRSFNLDRDVRIADDTVGQRLNTVDPNLKAFENSGGKLILYHGWSDPALSPVNTVNYYDNVVLKMGSRDAGSFTRLYMVPGMQHCGGGPGPNSFGGPILHALDHWVEKGKAPGTITATKYKDDSPTNGVARTRPLCPYPQVARYKGSGSIDDAASFSCSAR